MKDVMDGRKLYSQIAELTDIISNALPWMKMAVEDSDIFEHTANPKAAKIVLRRMREVTKKIGR